jgi:hypothetical protein
MEAQNLESEAAEILIIGKDNPNIYLAIAERLNQALKDSSSSETPQIFAKVSTDLKNLVEVYADHLVPPLVFFDMSTISRDPNEAPYLQNYVHGIKVLDPGALIVGLADTLPEKKEITQWMKVGISVWLKKDFTVSELDSSLKEAFAQRVSMIPRKLRVKVDHNVEVRMASLAQASVAEVIDLGLGGMFIRTSPSGIKPGDKIEFSVKVVHQLGGTSFGKSQSTNPIDEMDELSETSQNFGGTALVVWVRSITNNHGPEGIGVQFLTVDSKTQRFFEDALVKRKTRVFIPEG